jgi:hypothetical protein
MIGYDQSARKIDPRRQLSLSVTLAAVQLDTVSLLERGFHKPGDVKNRLEYCVGQLALSIIRL